jgi:pyrroloquinoline quinone biosynthesis protein B
MRIRILGSAAGGGFPQWNCACRNCSALRAGNFQGTARSQAQVAISSATDSWFLLGASPDLRAQIEATPDLQPRESASRQASPGNSSSGEDLRQSPIAGVILANADVDHALGLLLLRELQPLMVYATNSTHRILAEDNSMFAMLNRAPGQITWSDYKPGASFPLRTPSGEEADISCRALALGMHYPAYVSSLRQSDLTFGEASLGLILESPSGKRLAYMPAVPQIDAALIREFESVDVLLFDGTFWSSDELIRIQGDGQTAEQMGHVPVSSADGSLARLAQLRRPRKIYIHINNTNPMLDRAGPEHRQVHDAGWEIAEDGWQFDL